MIRYYLLLTLLSLCLGFSCPSIVNAAFVTNSTGGNPYSIARSIYKKDIKRAFALIEDEIRLAKKAKEYFKLAEGHTLLARFNEFINEVESAEANLEEALRNLKLEKPCKDCHREIHAEISLVKAYINIRSQNNEAAADLFKKAQSSDKILIKYPAMEGQADAVLALGNSNEARKLYETLILKYQDSYDYETQSRLASKKATLLANSGNIDEAVDTYADAFASKSNSAANGNSDKYMKEANKAIISNSRKNDLDVVEVSKKTIGSLESKKLPETKILKEKINLTELLIEEKKFSEAEKMIEDLLVSKHLDETDMNKVYDLKSKVSANKKDYKEAYEDLNRKKASPTFKKKEDIYKNIDIVRNQSKFEIELKDIDLKEKDTQINKIKGFFLFAIIGGLMLLTLAALIFSFTLWRNIKAKNKANQKLELKSLRTQMNPHFIFNSMNSINNFISKNDERAANKFIADFSKLIRKIMDFSQKEFISIEEEIELLDIYLRLEQSRFRDKFEYSFEKDPSLKDIQIDIPPMLIQPFLENAIWHGLRYKEEKGFLQLKINKSSKGICVEIRDNGIGRKKSLDLKTKNQKQYKSTGMTNIKKRIDLINELYKLDYKYSVTDAEPNKSGDIGTIVKLHLEGTAKIAKV